jgi:tetratricopeptide (TPR) repeat protein
MKGKTLKAYLVTALILLFVVSGHSQRSQIPVYGTSGDNFNCRAMSSAYRSYFKLELYEDAYETWIIAFDNCPDSNKRMYLDGVTMYRSFIEAAPEGPVREGLIDTLMLIYDRRVENFGEEGNVLGRQGRDLLIYRRGDIEQVQKAYEMLEMSIELQGKKSQESVLLLSITSGIALNKDGRLDDSQVIEDYIMAIEILVQQEKRSSRWERTKEKIDELILKEDFISCDAFDRYFEPEFEQNKNDKHYLEKLIIIYNTSGCDRSEIYAAALENQYRIKPGSESAHKLAILFITLNEYEKAAEYLKEAVQGDNIDRETRAEWYYELAVVSNANEDYCTAIEYAREANMLRSEYGKAYMLLGDAFVASRENLGDDFQQRTAFWAAADMYQKAASVDPDLAEVANQKLAECRSRYPNNEDIFFRDLKDGDTYLVGGCIKGYTTVRSDS